MWKRCGSGKPQQSAAANSAMWLAEPSERQAAVDRSSCSRLTSRRSPVRAGHRPSSGVRFQSTSRQRRKDIPGFYEMFVFDPEGLRIEVAYGPPELDPFGKGLTTADPGP